MDEKWKEISAPVGVPCALWSWPVKSATIFPSPLLYQSSALRKHAHSIGRLSGLLSVEGARSQPTRQACLRVALVARSDREGADVAACLGQVRGPHPTPKMRRAFFLLIHTKCFYGEPLIKWRISIAKMVAPRPSCILRGVHECSCQPLTIADFSREKLQMFMNIIRIFLAIRKFKATGTANSEPQFQSALSKSTRKYSTSSQNA